MSTLEEKIAEENLIVAKFGPSFALYFCSENGIPRSIYIGSLASADEYKREFAIELADLVREHAAYALTTDEA